MKPPSIRRAGPELRVMAHWETHVGWLLGHCSRWPRAFRQPLTQRLETHALDVLEYLVVARYEPRERVATLRQLNLALERMRLLWRLACARGITSTRAFGKAMEEIDEAGRMVHGWRQSLQ